MLAQNNPDAWQELLQLLAESMVDEAMARSATPVAPGTQEQLFATEPACAH
ncbi:hypothetical protein PQR12_31135 [Paraburkholderia nemoris]|uniref:hypothetical protein n=1 Tax=Paraburkholderia nemoris TaxID=2793076 RepID=UPI0038B9484B